MSQSHSTARRTALLAGLALLLGAGMAQRVPSTALFASPAASTAPPAAGGSAAATAVFSAG